MAVCGLALEGASQSSAVVTFRLAPSMSLSVWGESPSGSSLASIYTIPRPTAQERQAGFLERLNALKLIARSNVPWALRVRAQEPDMGPERGRHLPQARQRPRSPRCPRALRALDRLRPDHRLRPCWGAPAPYRFTGCA
jgi:hypothetical protein